MQRWDHIVWDWNGTLLEDRHTCVAVLNEMLAEQGLAPISEERYREVFDFPVIEFYRQLGFPTDQEVFERISHRFIRRYAERAVDCQLQPGAWALLQRLREDQLGQSVLSAAQQDSLERAVEEHGLADCFEHVVGAPDFFAHGKEEAGRAWIGARTFDPGRVVLVGDTLHDHRVAEAMGTDCILLAHGHHSRERLERTGRPVLEGFAALAELLEG